MECSCACGYDSGDRPEFFREEVITARKPHVCYECFETIASGEQYEYVVGKWDGSFDQIHTCLPCVAIRTSLCGGYWEYGALRETISECMGFDYITGETQCWECCETIPGDTGVCPECGTVEAGSQEEYRALRKEEN